MSKLKIAKFTLAAVLGAMLASPAATAGGTPMIAVLSGANEVGPGDPDGTGLASLTLNSGQEEICWELLVEDIAAPTRAHIHQAPAGANGPIVVFFFDTVIAPPIPVPDPLAGCVDVPRELVKEIRKNPEQYYFNVHNADFPGGAIRGQLERARGR